MVKCPCRCARLPDVALQQDVIRKFTMTSEVIVNFTQLS